MSERQLNLDMRSAQRNKKDEFYTEYNDIEKEMIHYKNYFKDKTVYCPCDSESSNFYKFFIDKFEEYGLKKLICTGFNHVPGLKDKIIIKTKSLIEYIIVDYPCDMFSDHLRHLYEESDIVCTNPPFSRFREFISLLIDFKKDFLIIGNMNSILTKDIFKYIVSGDVFWGVSIHSGDRLFKVPSDYPIESTGYEIRNNVKYIKVKGVRWFTNIRPDNMEILKPLELTCSIKDRKYETFDFIEDVICIDKTSDIPYDYDGLMGVPLTFFDKFNPEQFEIIDGVNRYLVLDNLNINDRAIQNKEHLLTVNGKIKYFRILIKRKQ